LGGLKVGRRRKTAQKSSVEKRAFGRKSKKQTRTKRGGGRGFIGTVLDQRERSETSGEVLVNPDRG